MKEWWKKFIRIRRLIPTFTTQRRRLVSLLNLKTSQRWIKLTQIQIWPLMSSFTLSHTHTQKHKQTDAKREVFGAAEHPTIHSPSVHQPDWSSKLQLVIAAAEHLHHLMQWMWHLLRSLCSIIVETDRKVSALWWSSILSSPVVDWTSSCNKESVPEISGHWKVLHQ